MQQIADWLEKLGMSEYVDRFAENRIDFSVLPDLTDQDLEKLGVLLGDRRKMLRAIAKLEALDAPIAVATTTPATPRSVDTAERRQVTVMFSDLVGSTACSARMDPEDLREVISGYQKCVADTVQRFGGFVAKYMGDGVLVYFGYPQAHEDDAERAVRAGLELVAAISGFEDPRAPTDACGHRNGTGSSRRPDRLGCFSGAGNRRRDTEPFGALAKHCRAQQRCCCGKHTEALGQLVRA